MIKFDTAGFRTEFQIDILTLGKQRLEKIGMWKPDNGIEWTLKNRVRTLKDVEKNLSNKHFIVLISLVCSRCNHTSIILQYLVN